MLDATEAFAHALWPTLRCPHELAEIIKQPRNGPGGSDISVNL